MLLYLVYCILGGTNTAEGIRWAQDIISFSDRAHVQKLIILLTNDESITNSAAALATSAKNEGIYIIVVGKRLHGVCLKKIAQIGSNLPILSPFPWSKVFIHASLFCAMGGAGVHSYHYALCPSTSVWAFLDVSSLQPSSYYLQHHCRLFSLHGHTTKIISG